MAAAADKAIFEQESAEMRERLSKLTMKQLKQIARDERITLGYDASRKDSAVAAIVSARRHRALAAEDDPATHPWRKFRSVKGGGGA